MKRLLLVLLLVGLLSGPAIAQCGPQGCGSRGCQIPGTGPQYPDQPPQMMPPGQRPLVPVPPAVIPEEVKQCHDSLVRVKSGQWGGSGTYLGSRLVVTCEHVVRNGTPQDASVRFPDGQTVGATVLGTDPASDLALLELTSAPPVGAVGVSVEEAAAQVGQAVFTAGYGKDNQLAISPGRIVNVNGYTIAYDPTNGQQRPRTTTEASGDSMSGDSGGAWLTEEGKLLGVVWGGRERERTVSATTVGLGDFLRGVCDRFRRPFPRPDTRPPVPVPPPPPVPVAPTIDLAPIVGRLDSISGDLKAIAGRVELLENPPKPKPNKALLGWLAAAAGLVAGAFLFFQTQGA